MDETRIARRKELDSLPLPDRTQEGFFGRNRSTTAAVIAVLAIFLLPMTASATEIGPMVALFLAYIFQFLTWIVGEILIVLVGALIFIAQYNGFVTATAVTNGWVIVRDIANMFFIIAILLIAFGTMLGIGQYHYSKTLPRLIIMAILVNFSRTICGLIIDFSQVVMLTFVNGFKEAAGGNFVNAFGLKELMETEGPQDGATTAAWNIAMGFMLAFALVSISAGVVVIMIAVLAVRIVYLWLLVVMSPLAFLATAMPITRASQFYGRWWENFNKQVIVGPFLAFFLWLALISASATGSDAINTQGFGGAKADTGETYNSEMAGALENANIVKFIISIGMLLGGVAMAQEMSSGAVGFGKSVLNRAGSVGMSTMKFGAKMGGKAIMASGGELAANKVKTSVLSFGTRVPILKSAAGEALGKHNANIEAKVGAAQAWMKELDPKERARFKGGIATSPDARARQLAAHQIDLDKAAKGIPTGMGATEFNKSLSEAERLGGIMKVDNTKLRIDAKKNSPTLIVDPDSIGAEHDQQVKSLESVAKAKRSKDWATANAQQIDNNVLSRGESLEIAKAMKSAHGTTAGDAMEKFSETTFEQELEKVKLEKPAASDTEAQAIATKNLNKIISDKQQAFKEDPRNFNYLSSAEQAKLVESKDASAVNNISADKYASTYSALDDNGKKVLAEQLAVKLDDKVIKQLPAEMAEAVRAAIKDDPSKVLSSGGTAQAAFKDLNLQGNFTSEQGRNDFKQWASQGSLPEKLVSLGPQALEQNGGTSNVAIEMVSRIEASDLQSMAQSGQHDTAQRVYNVANKMEGVDVEKAADQFLKTLPNNMKEQEIKKAYDDFKERLTVAKANATKIINDLSKQGSSLSRLNRAQNAEQKAAAKEQAKIEKGERYERTLLKEK
ncbi:MAG: hypothetical protein V1738_06170 [Patescibacteria group bacterium]